MTYIQNKTIQNYIHNVDTTISSEVISTTIEYYPGTEVTYTPTTGASGVIYECNLQVFWTPDAKSSYLSSRLQYSDDNGSTWNTFNATRIFEGSYSPSDDKDCFDLNWIFFIPVWSGQRKIRVAGRSNSSNNEYTVGKVWQLSAGSATDSCPHVSIYSVM